MAGNLSLLQKIVLFFIKSNFKHPRNKYVEQNQKRTRKFCMFSKLSSIVVKIVICKKLYFCVFIALIFKIAIVKIVICEKTSFLCISMPWFSKFSSTMVKLMAFSERIHGLFHIRVLIEVTGLIWYMSIKALSV